MGEAFYPVTVECLGQMLDIPSEEKITRITLDHLRGIINIHVIGDQLPDRAEGCTAMAKDLRYVRPEAELIYERLEDISRRLAALERVSAEHELQIRSDLVSIRDSTLELAKQIEDQSFATKRLRDKVEGFK